MKKCKHESWKTKELLSVEIKKSSYFVEWCRSCGAYRNVFIKNNFYLSKKYREQSKWKLPDK